MRNISEFLKRSLSYSASPLASLQPGASPVLLAPDEHRDLLGSSRTAQCGPTQSRCALHHVPRVQLGGRAGYVFLLTALSNFEL